MTVKEIPVRLSRSAAEPATPREPSDAEDAAQYPTITFTTLYHMFKAISRLQDGDVMTVRSISQEMVDRLDYERARRRGRTFRIRRYMPAEQLLMVVAPTRVHEALHRRLAYIIEREMHRMVGSHMSWGGIDSTTFMASGRRLPGGGSSMKEADSAGPFPTSIGHSWPTLVIETGQSQSLPSLRRDVKWLFSASNHAVKIVLLAKLSGQESRITIEKWVEIEAPVDTPTHQGATTNTTAPPTKATALQPVCETSISIDELRNISVFDRRRIVSESYIMDAAADETSLPLVVEFERFSDAAVDDEPSVPLLIEFEHLFLRPPMPGTAEGDILIDARLLQKVAASVLASTAL